MVAAPPKLEVRAVGVDDFDDIAPLLDLFANPKMSREDWRDMLFTYPWWSGAQRGFALYAGENAVGFIGTIFSERTIAGRRETFCNTSCWIVREEYRSASILLLRPVLALRDCTIVNWTPTDRSYDIFKKLGFEHLEAESLLVPPLAWPTTYRGSFTNDPAEFARSLSFDERSIHRDLATRPAMRHIVLRDGDATCYLVASRRIVKGVPIADIHHVGNRKFFWEHRGLAHLALFREFGALGLSIDRRFAGKNAPRLALRRPAMRLYRPAHPETKPHDIDGLFSEMMTLRL